MLDALIDQTVMITTCKGSLNNKWETILAIVPITE